MRTGFQAASSGTCSGDNELMTSLVLVFVRFIRTLGHGLKDAEFRALLFVLAGLLVCGAIFYSRSSTGASSILYFSVSTLATVGYGDLHPTTPLSKVFTMVYIVLGSVSSSRSSPR